MKNQIILLIHGAGSVGNEWENFEKAFSKMGNKVIKPTLRFHNRDCKSNPKLGNISILDYVSDMEKLIKNLNKKPIIIGHSMGGMIVQEMTKLIGNRVNKLICFATGSIGDIPGRFETMDETREKLKKEGAKSSFARVPPKWFAKGDKDKNYFLCANAVKNVSLETADNALLAMKNWRGIENLKNIKNETLIIWGDKDISYNFEQVDTLNKNIKNSRLEIFKNCSHNVHLEEPDRFNNLVNDFISK